MTAAATDDEITSPPPAHPPPPRHGGDDDHDGLLDAIPEADEQTREDLRRAIIGILSDGDQALVVKANSISGNVVLLRAQGVQDTVPPQQNAG